MAKAGVVVIHEYWGVNEQIQKVAERWRAEGFLVAVPDLYHGVVAKTAQEAQAQMSKLDWGKAVSEIAAAVESLRAQGAEKVAITGYCMGGALAFAAATMIGDLAAVVPFYGVPPQADWSKVTAPVQAHFAANDPWASVDKGKQIQQALAGKMELHVYDAEHAFCNERRPEVYNADAANQAWGRTVAFVRQHTA
jgi:carboxymethylenebutenolidase